MHGAKFFFFLAGAAFSVEAVPVVALADELDPGAAFAGVPAADAAAAGVLEAFIIARCSSTEG